MVDYAVVTELFVGFSWVDAGPPRGFAGLDLPLKVIKFFHRQASKEFDAPFHLKRDLQKMPVFLLLGTFEGNRILDAPMGGDRRAGEDGRSLAGIAETVMTKSKRTSAKSCHELLRAPVVLTLKSSRRILRTSEWTSPVGALPPLYTSNRSPPNERRKHSAKMLRSAFRVQRKRTRNLGCMAGFFNRYSSLRCPLLSKL
jgi:hypothetical protein